MSQKGKTEGLEVSDSMVDQYLFGTYGVLDGDGMSNRDLEQLNRSVNNGQISMAGIRRHLKMELLSQQMTMLSFAGIPRVPSPLESVDYYAKVNKKIECEIFPVSIKEYVDTNASPSEAEIRKLYEKGKFSLKDPSGKRPGFKLPRRVKLQYFVGDYQDFVDKATESLSDEEIQAKYDELIAQESELVMEIVIDEDEGDNDMPAINLEGDDDADSSEEEAAPEPSQSSEPAMSEEPTEPADGDQSYRVGPTDSKFVLVSMPAQDGEGAVEVPAAEPAGAGEVVDVIVDQVEGAAEAVQDAVVETVEGTPQETVETDEIVIDETSEIAPSETPEVTESDVTETEVAETTATDEPAATTESTDSTTPGQTSETPAGSKTEEIDIVVAEDSPAHSRRC